MPLAGPPVDSMINAFRRGDPSLIEYFSQNVRANCARGTILGKPYLVDCMAAAGITDRRLRNVLVENQTSRQVGDKTYVNQVLQISQSGIFVRMQVTATWNSQHLIDEIQLNLISAYAQPGLPQAQMQGAALLNSITRRILF